MNPKWNSYRTSVEILGPPQFGKTTFIVECVRTHILNDNRVTYFAAGKDDAFDGLRGFMEHANPDYRAVFLNASDPVASAGYNPFHLPKGRDLSAHVSALAEYASPASDSTFEGRFPEQETSECFFAHLCLSRVPIWEQMHLFDFANRKEWARLEIPEAYAYQAHAIASTDARSWEYKVGGLRRFLRPFATSTSLRRILSVAEPVEIGALYEQGVSLFVKAAPSAHLSAPASRALLSFMLADILQVGIENAGRNRITFVYCDELQMYAPASMGDILDTVLSSGMRFTVAHHHDKQFSDERLRESLKMSCGIKVIFGGLSAEIRAGLAENYFVLEVVQDMHRQPRIAHVPTYWEDDALSTTERDDGTSSSTLSSRLVPEYEEVQTGWDDYDFREKLSRLASRLHVPRFRYTVLFPDGSWHQDGVHQLRRYLPKPQKVLQFENATPTERSARRATSPRKKSPLPCLTRE